MPAMATALEVDQTAPDFTLPRAGGGNLSLAEERAKGPVVLVFFPFAFSGTCTKEMCTFRDREEEWTKLHANVVGVSIDSTFTQVEFAKRNQLQMPLGSDLNKKVAASFGVLYENFKGLGSTAKRSVFVIDRDGTIRYRWVTEDAGMEPPYDEVRDALEGLE